MKGSRCRLCACMFFFFGLPGDVRPAKRRFFRASQPHGVVSAKKKQLSYSEPRRQRKNPDRRCSISSILATENTFYFVEMYQNFFIVSRSIICNKFAGVALSRYIEFYHSSPTCWSCCGTVPTAGAPFVPSSSRRAGSPSVVISVFLFT
jgi:hypothetical protein